MGHFDILLGAVALELLFGTRFDHNGHTLLRLADRQLRRIQTAVLGRHAIEVNIQAVGQLADGYAHTARTEVVRLLDQARHFRTAEQPLQLALFGGVALLHLTAAHLERLVGMLLRRTRRTAHAVAARAAAEQQDHVARHGGLPTHVFGFHGAHHGTDFQTFGHIVGMIHLADVGRGQSDLIAVARITGSGLEADDALGQFAGQRFAYGLIDISRTRHTHRLIDVAATRQRIADGTAQAGRSSAERFDLGRVVMGFVLELQEPFLGPVIDVHIDENAACVVLLAHLQVVEQSLAAQVTGTDRRQVHQADALALAPQFAADFQVKRQRAFDLVFHERLLDRNVLQLGREGRMTAMVAPVRIENPQLGFERIATLSPEIFDHFAQVVGIHRQTVLLAVGIEFRIFHLPEPVQYRHRFHGGAFQIVQDPQILLARLHGIDIIATNTLHRLLGKFRREDQQLRTLDLHLGRRIDQPHAVHGRSRSLVELSGQALHSQKAVAAQIARIRHGIGNHLAEDPVTALLQQFVRKTEQVVHVQQPQAVERKIQVGIQVAEQALGLDPEFGVFLNENTVTLHYLIFDFISQICRPTWRHTPRRSHRRKSRVPSCAWAWKRSCRKYGHTHRGDSPGQAPRPAPDPVPGCFSSR